MGRRRFNAMEGTTVDGANRRWVALGLVGTALGTLGLCRIADGTLAHDRTTTPKDEHDLDLAIQRMRAATAAFINGETEAWKAMCSHRPDATLFGGWGGHERGWEQLGPRYDWASARFAGGEVAFEEIARVVTPDLAYTVHIERNRARLTGRDETVAIALRVSHVYRHEEGEWKLAHRHADPLVAIQVPESVVEPAGSGTAETSATAIATP